MMDNADTMTKQVFIHNKGMMNILAQDVVFEGLQAGCIWEIKY